MGNLAKKSFDMWEKRIFFEEGLYYYRDGNGNTSIISKERAREHERDYYRYQADMDVNRGGIHPDSAYPRRGFSKSPKGWWKYTRPYQVDEIREEIAEKCIMDTYTIPEKIGNGIVNFIEKRAFLGCNGLTGISMSGNITDIGESAFVGCEALEEITLSDNLSHIGRDAFKDTLFYKNELNWNNGALYLDNWLIKVDSSVSGMFKVMEGTVGTADYAFSGCENIESVILTDSVKYIGNYLFDGCSGLKNINFPREIISFGNGVFYECTGLASVNLPIGINSLNGIFTGNVNLTGIIIPEGVTEIGREAFKGCVNLTDIILPHSIQVINANAFKNTGYVNDRNNWENGVLYLGEWLLKADDGVSGEYHVKEGTIGIADEAFGKFMGEACPRLTKVSMPDTIKYIGCEAFNGCSKLECFEIPPLVTSLGRAALRACSSLREITIPKSVKSVEQWVFYDCMNLEKLIIENAALEIEGPAIVSCPKLTIYAKEGSTAQAYALEKKIPFKALS